MDQFRGYTVAGMFVVNFVGGLAAMPAILKHHDIYFSYADTIMPSFMFAAGFSYRLAVLRRLAQNGPARTYSKFLIRSLGLILVSLVMYAEEDFTVKHWGDLLGSGAWNLIAGILKANLWETLAIIGVTQIFLMPVIARSTPRSGRHDHRVHGRALAHHRSRSISTSCTASRTGWTTSGD